MGQGEKRSYLTQIRGRYQKAGRAEKSKILDEFCAICEYHRKHAIRLLRVRPKHRTLAIKQGKRRGRQSYYSDNAQLLKALRSIWKATDYMCSKKLVVVLTNWLPHYEAIHEQLDDRTRQQLVALSAATIDRLLKPYRAKSTKRFCTTKPGKLLKNQIPIKTDQWNVSEPGFVEADTVAHCGHSLVGDFAWSVTLTDIKTTWTEIRAIWNKGATGVVEAIDNVEKTLPFKLLGFDCDNGSEFLNYHLIRHFSQRPQEKLVQFTRSRPYHKNDNAHVEQKNWTHVRQLFGYDRIDSLKCIELMNDLYANEWSFFQNYFCPTMKLIKKEKINAKYKRFYDKPQTPYQRLLACHLLSKTEKKHLENVHNSLNPFVLKEVIESKLKAIFKYVKVTSNVRQRI